MKLKNLRILKTNVSDFENKGFCLLVVSFSKSSDSSNSLLSFVFAKLKIVLSDFHYTLVA